MLVAAVVATAVFGAHAQGAALETVLLNFSGLDGVTPSGGLTLGPDGNFYGVTSAGGVYKSLSHIIPFPDRAFAPSAVLMPSVGRRMR
jgi:hypothetical protein